MYQIANPQFFYLLAILPVLLLLYFFFLGWRKKARLRFGDPYLLQKLAPDQSKAKGIFKLVLGLLILSALIIALVNPKIGSRLETVKREGVDIVFALDVSKSMLAEDVQPNRLEKARQLISRTLDKLVSDRVGIIIYAGQAYPQLPITTDHNAARLFLKSIDTDMISSQGTAIAEAIELATGYFDDEDQKNRVLIILSDGEDHESGYEEAIKQARNQGITIYTIGIGSQQGAPIPEFRRGYRLGYKKDASGEVVISRLQANILKEIAADGKGEYIAGSSSRIVSEFIAETITEMEKKEFESQVFAEYEDQFQWFLGIALLLLLLDTFILQRKTQWFKKLNLFDDEKHVD